MFEKDTSYKILPLSRIAPDPNQPRKQFDQESLQSLADSIRELGVLSPITVYKMDGQYRIIAGERRWRAAGLAGLNEIPCVVRHWDEEKKQLAALVENLQRCDLDVFEEAAGIRDLIDKTGLSQAEVAKKIGKSPSCVANKLRLLGLSDAIRRQIREHKLTERHARALLSLPEDMQSAALTHIIQKKFTVDKAEQYIHSLLSPPPKPSRKVYIKDIRLFINSIDHSLRLLSKQGIAAHSNKSEDDQFIYYSISIPKVK
jgi:ParB family chromosome partitioning protein